MYFNKINFKYCQKPPNVIPKAEIITIAKITRITTSKSKSQYDLAKFLLLILLSLNENTIKKINPTKGIENKTEYPK